MSHPYSPFTQISYPLALSFSRLYAKMSEDFFNLDREPDLNFVFFSVQLFTAPSLALLVIKEDDTVFNILSMLTTNFAACIEDGQLKLGLRFITERRYYHALNDLRYFLQSECTKTILSRSQAVVKKFLDFLSIFQGMDSFSRESEAHVEFESESWIPAYNLSMQLSHLINHFANLFDDRESYLFALKECIKYLKDTNISFPYWKNQDHLLSIFSQSQESADSGWKKELEVGKPQSKISFHHPLHWLFGQLLIRATKLFEGDFNFLPKLITDENETLRSFFLKIIEPGIRIRALIAQIRSGYW
jgi:E3 ubiquitin-protein ligase UBR1